MGKTSDIESISNSVSTIILHEILVEYSNRQESLNHLNKEVVEYRGQSVKKIRKIRLNDDDKKLIKSKVMRKIRNKLKTKYSDIQVPSDVIKQKVNEGIYFFFD